jgi:hypothetical protein
MDKTAFKTISNMNTAGEVAKEAVAGVPPDFAGRRNAVSLVNAPTTNETTEKTPHNRSNQPQRCRTLHQAGRCSADGTRIDGNGLLMTYSDGV